MTSTVRASKLHSIVQGWSIIFARGPLWEGSN